MSRFEVRPAGWLCYARAALIRSRLVSTLGDVQVAFADAAVEIQPAPIGRDPTWELVADRIHRADIDGRAKGLLSRFSLDHPDIEEPRSTVIRRCGRPEVHRQLVGR